MATPPSGIFACSSSADCPLAFECAPDGLCRVPSEIHDSMAAKPMEAAGMPTAGSAEAAPTAGSAGMSAQAGQSGTETPMLAAGNGAAQAHAGESGMTSGAAGASSHCQDAACGACRKCGSQGTCEPLTDPNELARAGCLQAGERCESETSCMSRFCVDGRCCGVSNCPLCSSCAVAGKEGSCAPLGGRDDPEGCSGNLSCGAGVCAGKTVGAVAAPGASDTIAGAARLAQTINIQNAGQLVELRLGLDCSSGQFNVELFDVSSDGSPGRARIASAEIPAGIIPGNHTVAGLAIKPPLRVTAGQRLAIVVSMKDTGLTCNLDRSNQDVYVDGAAYKDSGTQTWTRQAYDFAFDLLLGR